METVNLVARLVIAEHANGVQREPISLRAQRANFVFRGTTEVQGALKLSATNDFTWWRVSNCQATLLMTSKGSFDLRQDRTKVGNQIHFVFDRMWEADFKTAPNARV